MWRAGRINVAGVKVVTGVRHAPGAAAPCRGAGARAHAARPFGMIIVTFGGHQAGLLPVHQPPVIGPESA
jgi:hypothetical protein